MFLLACTGIGALGTLVTLVAVFFRVGSTSGRFETRLDHVIDEAHAFRLENHEQHEHISRQLFDLHGRVAGLEGRQRRGGEGI